MTKPEYTITPEMIYGPDWESLIPEGRRWEFRPPKNKEECIADTGRTMKAPYDYGIGHPRIVILPLKFKRKQYILTETGEVRPPKKGEYVEYSDNNGPVLFDFLYDVGRSFPIYRLEVREVEE